MSKIKCPHCGESLDIQELNQHEIEAKVKQETNTIIENKRVEYEAATKKAVAKAKEDQGADSKMELKSLKNRIDSMSIQHNNEISDLRLESEEEKTILHNKLRSATSNISASGQLRGEIGENKVKEILEKHFPNDTIGEVPRGANGVDWVLEINGKKGKKIDSIYIEVKNTESSFLKSWITKLRNDMKADGIQAGVLITKVFPAEHKEKTQYIVDGSITVCKLNENDFWVPIGLIRSKLIELNRQVNVDKASRSDIPDKLFKYITSSEFEQSITSIQRAIVKFREQIRLDKLQFKNRLKKRESYLNEIESSLMDASTEIRFISPNSRLGLPEETDEE